MRRLILSSFLLAGTLLVAQMAPQTPAPGQGPGPGPGPGQGPGGPMMRRGWDGMQGGGDMHMRGGMRRHHMGKWWKNPEVVQQLGLNEQQTQQIEKIFSDHRMALVDLHAALQKAELGLEPLISADQPNEAQVIAQIDRVAAARANLEKSNAQMLLGIRRVLTPEQWKKVHSMHEMRGGPGEGPGMQMRMRHPGPGGPPQPQDEETLS